MSLRGVKYIQRPSLNESAVPAIPYGFVLLAALCLAAFVIMLWASIDPSGMQMLQTSLAGVPALLGSLI